MEENWSFMPSMNTPSVNAPRSVTVKIGTWFTLMVTNPSTWRISTSAQTGSGWLPLLLGEPGPLNDRPDMYGGLGISVAKSAAGRAFFRSAPT